MFRTFFNKLKLPETLLRKTNYHELAPYVPEDVLDSEVKEKLDAIVEVARSSQGATEA